MQLAAWHSHDATRTPSRKGMFEDTNHFPHETYREPALAVSALDRPRAGGAGAVGSAAHRSARVLARRLRRLHGHARSPRKRGALGAVHLAEELPPIAAGQV